LRRELDQDGLNAWVGGIFIERRLVRPLEISPLGGVPGKRFRVVLGEGFKREIRLMAEALGNRVHSLRRTGIGNLSLKKLPSGAFNEYNYAEIKKMIHDGGEI
jgi:23S rRNA pseudouridine2605 synthase